MHNASDDNTPDTTELSPTYKALKLLAIVMGGVLAGGLVVMVAAMGKQVKPAGSKGCEPTSIALSAEDELMRLEEKGDRLVVWLKGHDGAVIIRHYDMCKGSILRDVRISGGKAPSPQPQGQMVPQPMPPR